MLFFWMLYTWKNLQTCHGFHFPQKYEASTAVFNIKKHIRMISEGSCDAEDWSNDAETTAFPLQKISHILQYCFCCIFD